ncbi:MAG: class I SAM-dependent methyltransferase [Clostridia bacterium]|nr:class I SAM-dependent methyltransferase [Clostridia bacterium]
MSDIHISSRWRDYELIDCSDGERLERLGETVLIRPDPQVIWKTPKGADWKRADARYIRSSSGGGRWEYLKKVPSDIRVSYGNLKFKIGLTGFKHTGLFPEQAANWDLIADIIAKSGRTDVRVLNLFAYTGAATVSALAAGAAVTHVDAAKGMVSWARENAALCGVADRPVRWIVDDCFKFVQREIRRGSRYDIIIMDPPSYGRGPGGEVWKLEDTLYDLVSACAGLLGDRALAFLNNSYTAGLSPSVMSCIMTAALGKSRGVDSYELGLPVSSSGTVLPCGGSCLGKDF